MNLYELDTKTLMFCKLDSTDSEVRSDKASSFLESYNTAYEKVMREKVCPWCTEPVVLGSDKTFLTSTLSKTCVLINDISSNADFSSGVGYGRAARYQFYEVDGQGTIVVPMAETGDTVYVAYRYMPSRLTHKEKLFTISGAQTSKTIPIHEAITEGMVDKLVGSQISVYDVSAGTYQTLKIASVTIGAAGAATVTVEETISPSVASGDVIYTNANTEYRTVSEYSTPQFDSFLHNVLCYYAAYEYFLTNDKHDRAISYLNLFNEALGKIQQSKGAKKTFKNLYSSQI